MYEKYYFKNFQELQDTIEFYREKCKRESSTLKYGLCEVAIHLAWSGIKMVDLIEIKLQDVDFKEKKIYISRLDRYISIDSMIFNNLIVFLDIKEYNAEDYVKPDYLIRTGKMTKLNLSYLSALISRMIGDNTTFNEGIDNTDKKIISYQRVFLSGIYYRARLDEINNGEISRKDLDRLNKLFQESYTKIDAKISIDISKRMIDYNDYLKYMYREEYYRTKS
jgi:hypothetical protein